MQRYDYLIVGAGFFGAVFAHEAAAHGKKCLVIDRRRHIGGNAFCETISGITVHKYGPHIFHTSDKTVWRYVNRFAEFNNFINSPLAYYNGRIYNLPFNMNTFYQLWGTATPDAARNRLAMETAQYRKATPANLEEQALYLVGRDIYEKFIKGYTEKQWGRPCRNLPASVIKRIPLRFIYDNNYFNDLYQGIPNGGYNCLFELLLGGCEVCLSADFFSNKDFTDAAEKIIFTGALDEYFSYRYGPLEYRTLTFETSALPISDYQGCAVVNYTGAEVPYTRVIEHKHFEFGKQPCTVITKEFPAEWTQGSEPFYPIMDERNQSLYQKYVKLAVAEKNVIFGGRLAEYKYYNMDEVVARALAAAKKEFGSLSFQGRR